MTTLMPVEQPHHPLAALSASADVMATMATLDLLYRYARDAAQIGSGTIVEIGAYRGGSTIALAKGVQDAGHGSVTSIDPHRPGTGIYGGTFSTDDHRIYLEKLQHFGVTSWVNHLCVDSETAAKKWALPIDLLWVDGDHSYAAVSHDIALWTPFIKDCGLVIFDDVTPGSEVEAAILDCLPFSRYRMVERQGNVLVLRMERKPRTLFLCGGMQSSGSTLVSWSFLQRQDLDGVLDMDNSVIQQDFAQVKTDSVWLKMTIGAFRLTEVADLFEAQGWIVRPLLIKRNVRAVLRSLCGKPYGFNGVTGEEPPIFIRLQRYLADYEAALNRGWPIIAYEDVVAKPRETLNRACAALGLPWDEGMMTWPKGEASIAYMANGNPTFMGSKRGSTDMLTAISKVMLRSNAEDTQQVDEFLDTLALSLDQRSETGTEVDWRVGAVNSMLPSAKFWSTQRHEREALLGALRHVETEHYRILNHAIFGRLLRFWRRFVNQSFPAPH